MSEVMVERVYVRSQRHRPSAGFVLDVAAPTGPQWVKPWFAEWLKGLNLYCAVMGEPIPSTFRQAFKLFPPSEVDR